jgi:uncharacterized metal-binding protein YceD (DUF177 family)
LAKLADFETASSYLDCGVLMMVEGPSTGAEFSRLVDVSEIKRTPWRAELKADEAAREAIAARFGLESVERFEACIAFRRTPIGLIQLEGSIEADVVQQCVVSLEPVRSEIRESFEVYYSETVGENEAGGDLTMDDELWPDPVVDGKIDIGEAATEHLGLALDPYPRREGVEFEAPSADGEPAPTQRPFAGLAELTAKSGRSKRER